MTKPVKSFIPERSSGEMFHCHSTLSHSAQFCLTCMPTMTVAVTVSLAILTFVMKAMTYHENSERQPTSIKETRPLISFLTLLCQNRFETVLELFRSWSDRSRWLLTIFWTVLWLCVCFEPMSNNFGLCWKLCFSKLNENETKRKSLT